MALVAELKPGRLYKVTEGPLHGEAVEIVGPLDERGKVVAVRDGQPNQRKILVKVGGVEHYVIPRQIDGTELATIFSARPAPIVPTSVPKSVVQDAPVVNDDEMIYVADEEYVPITDPMDERLDHLRPKLSTVKKYINRMMPNGMTDVEFLMTFTNDQYRDENQGRPCNIMLKGDTQGGKTMLVEVLAYAWMDKLQLPKPMPIFTLNGSSGVTDYDLFGQPTTYNDPQRGGKERIVWLPGQVDLWARVGGILAVEEINALSERVAISLNPVADHRHMFVNRNKAVKVPGDGFMPETVECQMNGWIIGTYNEGYRGMTEMNESLISRFRHIEWGYDKDIEEALVASPAIHLLADGLRLARNQGSTLRTPVGTVALQRLDLDVQTFGPDVALEIFAAAFKPKERDAVRHVIDSNSVNTLLKEEQRAKQQRGD